MSVSVWICWLFLPSEKNLTTVQRRKWSPTANDPQTGNDPQIEPQMIPNRKWSPMWTANDPHRKITNGMDFGFLDFNFFSFFIIFFHQLKDKLDQIKEKIYRQRKL